MFGDHNKSLVGGAYLTSSDPSSKCQDVSGFVGKGWDWIINPTGQILSGDGYRFCTGFLIGEKTFLTAGHCFGEVCKQYEDGHYQVRFNYHTGVKESKYKVDRIIEHGQCFGCDYGILKLETSAAYKRFGTLEVQPSNCDARETKLVVAQHPGGGKKQIAFGSLDGYWSGGFFAHTMDTAPGSSGSPVAKINQKAVVGVHVSAADETRNRALAIETIAGVSEIVNALCYK